MTWVEPIVAHNARRCGCGHRYGDHGALTGCQHLEPAYDERGFLVRHDRCPCKEGVDREARWRAREHD